MKDTISCSYNVIPSAIKGQVIEPEQARAATLILDLVRALWIIVSYSSSVRVRILSRCPQMVQMTSQNLLAGTYLYNIQMVIYLSKKIYIYRWLVAESPRLTRKSIIGLSYMLISSITSAFTLTRHVLCHHHKSTLLLRLSYIIHLAWNIRITISFSERNSSN